MTRLDLIYYPLPKTLQGTTQHMCRIYGRGGDILLKLWFFVSLDDVVQIPSIHSEGITFERKVIRSCVRKE